MSNALPNSYYKYEKGNLSNRRGKRLHAGKSNLSTHKKAENDDLAQYFLPSSARLGGDSSVNPTNDSDAGGMNGSRRTKTTYNSNDVLLRSGYVTGGTAAKDQLQWTQWTRGASYRSNNKNHSYTNNNNDDNSTFSNNGRFYPLKNYYGTSSVIQASDLAEERNQNVYEGYPTGIVGDTTTQGYRHSTAPLHTNTSTKDRSHDQISSEGNSILPPEPSTKGATSTHLNRNSSANDTDTAVTNAFIYNLKKENQFGGKQSKNINMINNNNSSNAHYAAANFFMEPNGPFGYYQPQHSTNVQSSPSQKDEEVVPYVYQHTGTSACYNGGYQEFDDPLYQRQTEEGVESNCANTVTNPVVTRERRKKRQATQSQLHSQGSTERPEGDPNTIIPPPPVRSRWEEERLQQQQRRLAVEQQRQATVRNFKGRCGYSDFHNTFGLTQAKEQVQLQSRVNNNGMYISEKERFQTIKEKPLENSNTTNWELTKGKGRKRMPQHMESYTQSVGHSPIPVDLGVSDC